MEDHLTALLRSNNPPSESTITQVKGLLMEPSAELLATDAEIQRLDVIMGNLKHKRETLRKSMKEYNSILSPVRRLPVDILHEIFYHCLPMHRNPIMDASEAPVLLTRICSSWRSIALSSPRIWSKLHIPLPGRVVNNPQLAPFEVLDAGNRAIAKTMELRCQVVQEWLERSGECPLSISVFYPTYQLYPDEVEEVGFTQEIFRTILLFARRWRSLELSVPFEVYERLQALLSGSSNGILPMLESLRAEIFEFGRGDNEERPFIHLLSPQLRRLSLRSIKATWDFRDLPTVWNRLTYLCFHSMFPETELLELLAQCRCLVDCKLLIQRRWGEAPGESSRQSNVVLPFLRALSINDGGSNLVMTKTFKALSLPALTSLEYQRPSYHPLEAEQPEYPPISLFALLENSPAIDRLVIDPVGIPSEELLRCLRTAHSATHIVLGQEPSPMDSNGNIIYPNQPIAPYPDIFDLKNLIISADSDMAHMEHEDDGAILLPNLENLEAYRLSSFSDSDLLRLISSRLDAWRRGAVTSALKHVRLDFCRPKELPGIEEEVLRLTKAAGVKLELKLVYSKKQPRNFKALSPMFGLTDDGRSWSLDKDGPSLFY